MAALGEWIKDLFIPSRLTETTDDAHRHAYGHGYTEGYEEAIQDKGINVDEMPHTASDGKVIGWGYRSITKQKRDLSLYSQEKAINAMYRLWNTHPLAKAMTEIVVDYILGDGVKYQYKNNALKDAVEDFVCDPVNRLNGEGLESLVREVVLFGEQVVMVFVQTGADVGGVASGLVRLGKIDPTEIKTIITAKDNKQDLIAVQLKQNADESEARLYKIIKPERRGKPLQGNENLMAYAKLVKTAGNEQRQLLESEITEAMTIPVPTNISVWEVEGNKSGIMQIQEAKNPKVKTVFDGACFLFQINKISTGLRGRPDLLPLIDWLDRFDQLFFDAAEHISLLNLFAWDLTIQGGSETSTDPETNLNRQLSKIAKLRPNSVYAHNEKVALEPKNPELRTSDVQTIIRQLRIFIVGGARIPEHWIAEGGYTNRATAEEMGQPTFRMLTHKQQYAKFMLETMIKFQLDVLIALGKLPDTVEIEDVAGIGTGDMIPTREAFEIIMPDINVSNTKTAAVAFELMSRSIVALRSLNQIPEDVAMKLISEMAELLGVHIDIKKALEDLQYPSDGKSPPELGEPDTDSELEDSLKFWDEDSTNSERK
jgi:hypothetical protein